MGKRKSRQEQQQLISSLSKKQKKHLKDFGEEHPFYDRDSGKEKPIQICELSENSEQSSSESDTEHDSEQVSTYHKLLATLKTDPDSDTEEEEEEEEEEEDELEEGSDDDELEEDSDEPKEKRGMADEGNTLESGKDVPSQKNSQEEPEDSDTSVNLNHEALEEFTDAKHESEFSLETNFVEEGEDASADQKEGNSSPEVTKDPFKCHMSEELEEADIDKILTHSKSVSRMKWPVLDQLVISSTSDKFGTIKPYKEVDLKQLHLHKPLASTWLKVNSPFLSKQGGTKDQPFTALQKELFCLMNSYKDLFYPERTALRNGEEVRHAYCLHALNHVLKANAQVLSNNAKRRDQKPGIDDDRFRDQGLTRPKVLMVVPFRESALRVVHILIGLLESASKKKIDVSNKKRFKGEFGSDPDEKPPNLKRPEDYEAVFAGNIDDHFRIGTMPFPFEEKKLHGNPIPLTLAKKIYNFVLGKESLEHQRIFGLVAHMKPLCPSSMFQWRKTGVAVLQKAMRLYAPFYSSDIIIASPLGLRTVIGAEGEKKRDYDFLSSIEVLIIDEVDVYLMQNWEHVLHLMNHLNLLPLESHGVDFSRVRMFSLNNWSKYYRQTLIFGALQHPHVNSIFNKHCFNYRGQVAIRNAPLTGSISQVVVQLPHVFRKLEAEDSVSVIDARFHFFIDKVLPEYRDAVMSHTLIYVPSYFDYVRLRNYFKKEELSFTHVCEYTSKSGISRARQFFLKGDKQFLMLTERFHFYKRYSIRGIRNLIFYELPTYPHFYSEVCNMMKLAGGEEEATLTCTVFYSKYDAQKLAAVVGVERAAQMLQSSKNVHLFVTGETE